MIYKGLLGSLQDSRDDHYENNKHNNKRCSVAFVAICECVLIEQLDDRLNFRQSDICLIHDHEHKVKDR